MDPTIISVRYSTTRYRPKPQLGDRRTTKKHGLQIRIVETNSDGAWIRGYSGYYYCWCKPKELIGTRFEYLLTDEEKRATRT